MAKELILIIEDDTTMLRCLKDNFEFQGYRVKTAADGEAGLSAALDCGADLVILDIMLPKINGYEICRLIRKEGLDVPVIILTAKGHEGDVVLGLNLGADDYVTKPFSIKELLARANAFLRRRRRAESQAYRSGPFELDVNARKATKEGMALDLTPKEFKLLALLVKRTGCALTRDEILRRVWGYSIFVTPRSVDRCVTTLRKKLEPDPATPTFIKTIRSVGYRFEAPDAGTS